MEDDRLRRRDELRQRRIALERAGARAAARRRRLRRLVTVVGGALAIVALIVVLTSDRRDASASGRVVGASATERMLTGVPQHGPTLGDPTAPVRVVEFADPQCPFCRRFAIEELARLVQDYVRKGTVRIDFGALAFIGPDSLRAARVLEAAARQDKLWNVAELLYDNQRTENSGYATDAFLRRVAAAVPDSTSRD